MKTRTILIAIVALGCVGAVIVALRARRPNDLKEAEALHETGLALLEKGAYAESWTNFIKAFNLRAVRLGPQHASTRESRAKADEARAKRFGRTAVRSEAFYDSPAIKEARQVALSNLAKVTGDRRYEDIAGIYRTNGSRIIVKPKNLDAVTIPAFRPGEGVVLQAARNWASNAVDEMPTFNRFLQRKRQAPDKWLSVELRKWNKIVESGVSDDALVKMLAVMHPLEAVPVETEKEPAVMARAVLELKEILSERDLRLRKALEASIDDTARQLDRKRKLAMRRAEAKNVTSSESIRDSGTAGDPRIEVSTKESQLRKRVFSAPGYQRPAPPTVEQIQSVLSADAVVVDYLRYGRDSADKDSIETRYGAVVITKSKVSWVSLGEARLIDGLVTTYLDFAHRQSEDPPAEEAIKKVLSDLALTVWGPVKTEFPERVRVALLRPDGLLNFLSFATLRDNGRFVGSSCLITYLASARDLLRTNAAPEVTGKPHVEIWNSPDFSRRGKTEAKSKKSYAPDWPQRDGGFLSKKFDPLPGAATEANVVKSILESAGRFEIEQRSGLQVAEPEFRKIRPPYILHLATHGFFLRSTASGNANQISASPSLLGMRPLFRSGLAFSGANTTLEAWRHAQLPAPDSDGVVFAADVAELDLRGTWLVVLSACETGTGTAVDGEGVLGLRRAFLNAGATHVISTLWKVSDTYTAEFMERFYRSVVE